MPISWTAETHETLLVAIIAGGFIPIFNNDKLKEVIAAWPANKGPAPTVSALSQHLNGLRRKVNGSTAASVPATPASGHAKKSATSTFGSAPRSRGKASAGRNTLFSGAASNNMRARKQADTDDSEPEGGDSCASTDDATSPTPKPGTNRKSIPGSALGKRGRPAKKEEEDGIDDSAIDRDSKSFMDALRAAAGQTDADADIIKKEPDWQSHNGTFKRAKVENRTRGHAFVDVDEGV